MNIHADDVLQQIREIADYVRAVDPDDDQLLADMIEAETDLDAVLDLLIEREATIADHITALGEREKTIRERKSRFNASRNAGRMVMQRLLDATGLRKIERPEATISLARVAPKVIDGPVESLADDLVRVERKPDKKAIKEALEAGADLPGWAMSNGGETVTVRRK